MTVWEFTLATLAKMGIYRVALPKEIEQKKSLTISQKRAAAKRLSITKKLNGKTFTKHDIAKLCNVTPMRAQTYIVRLIAEKKIYIDAPATNTVCAKYRVSSK